MFDAGSITGTLKLNTDPYAQGMLKATTIARIFPETVTAFLTNPLLGVADTLKKVAGSFVSFFGEAAEQGDAMGDLATSVGVAVESLTALGRVAEMAGSSTEGVADGYRFLGKAVNEAMTNAESDAAKTFGRLGIMFTDAAGTARPLESVMLDLSDALAALPEGGARTAAAMSLLGRSGTDLIPTLIQGRNELQAQMDQMRAYGVVVTSSAQESAGRWNDGMDEMGLAWRGLKQALVEPVRDALLPHLENLLDWTRANQPKIRQEITDTFKVIGNAFDATGPYFKWFGENWRQVAGTVAGVAAYMAGPAVMGAIVAIGPALLSVVAPLNAVRFAVIALQLAVNPFASATKLLSVGLGLLTAAAITNPKALEPLTAGLKYVAGAGMYVYDVLSKTVMPAIGRELVESFKRLQPHLPSTAGMFGLLGKASAGLQMAFQTVVSFLTDTVIPAFGKGLRAAFDWVGPKLDMVGAAFTFLWQHIKGVAAWIVGPGVDALVGVFSAAWGYVGLAIKAVEPFFAGVYNVMAGVVTWMRDVAAPAIGDVFKSAWEAVSPVLTAVGGYFRTFYDSIIGPFVGWIVGTAVPGVFGGIVSVWNAFAPAAAGARSVALGLWDLGRGLFSWLGPVVDNIQMLTQAAGSAIGGVINMLSALVRNVGDVLAWNWKNVLQPIMEWLWATVKPGLEFFGTLIGGLLDRVGNLLSWLGKVINLSGEATAAVNKVPQPATAPLAPPPVIVPRPAVAPPASAPTVPRFDFQAEAAKAAGMFKGMSGAIASGVSGGVNDGLSAVKDFKMPEVKLPAFRMPEFKPPSMPDFGNRSGVEPAKERFTDLQRGTAAAADEHAAAKHSEPVDSRQRNRDFEATKADFNRRIKEAQHNGADFSEVQAIRREKQEALQKANPANDTGARNVRTADGGIQTHPPINVQSPPLDEKKLATVIVQQMTAENSKIIDQAVAVGQAVRQGQSVAGAL